MARSVAKMFFSFWPKMLAGKSGLEIPSSQSFRRHGKRSIGAQSKTVDELVIFWNEADGQIEVAGIYFYGYWGNQETPNSFFELAEPWKAIESTIAFRQIEAEDGNFLIMTIWIKSWPTDPIWHSAVEDTLNQMITLRARVAWCGGETCSWSLMELDPETYNGCIYAASSVNTKPILRSDLSSNDLMFLSKHDISVLGSF